MGGFTETPMCFGSSVRYDTRTDLRRVADRRHRKLEVVPAKSAMAVVAGYQRALNSLAWIPMELDTQTGYVTKHDGVVVCLSAIASTCPDKSQV